MPRANPRQRTLVVVDVEVVGGREDGDDRGEAGGLALAVHAVAAVLRLVRPDDGQQPVVLQERAHGRVAAKKDVLGHGGGLSLARSLARSLAHL